MMRSKVLSIVLCAMLAATLSSEALAQKRKPAAKPQPAATAPADDGEKPSSDSGTTIVGEQESPIGLYITPWKDEYAERGLDRPARLLDEELLPIDKATFGRQVEYFDKIDKYRKAKLAAGETIK